MARAGSTTARRYAEAAFEIAQRDGTVGQWRAELDVLGLALADPAVTRRLEDPNVPVDARHAALKSLFKEGMSEKMSNLMVLILRRRRLESVPDIAREFRRLYHRQANIYEATATSAVTLGQAEGHALRKRLEQMTGGSIELDLQVDPALLGGVQVRLGDQLIDGSVRGRLERLRSRLATGSLTP